MSYGKRVDHASAWCVLSVAVCLTGCSQPDDELSTGDPMIESSMPVESVAGRLKAAHPNAGFQVEGNRIKRVFGAITNGDTPKLAAADFRQRTAVALGLTPDALEPIKSNPPTALPGSSRINGSAKHGRTAATDEHGVGLMYDPATGKHKFRLFAYQQWHDGVPVFRAGLRTLVRERDAKRGQSSVVWANSDLRPIGEFRARMPVVPRSVDLHRSLLALSTSAALTRHGFTAPKSLSSVSPPTATIFAGVGRADAAPRMAVQYMAKDTHGPGKWTFVADADTGEILHIESNVHFDVSGTVHAEVVAGPESMECGVLDVAPLPYAEVVSASGSAFTNDMGEFNIVESGSGPITVVASITGQYFELYDASGNSQAGNSAAISLVVTPPGPANFLFQDPEDPPEHLLAQSNAYKHVNALRDMLLTYLPEYPILAEQTDFRVNVNLTGLTCEITGGAWYDDDSAVRSLNFCQRTTERANTAFGSIVHHEYGHHIIDVGGSAQNEYGEGMADTIAMLFSRDPQIGIGYHLDQCAEPLRNAARDCQYSATDCSSCGSGLYECGALLSSTIWDIWQELNVTQAEDADDIIRSLVLSSIPMHTGDGIDETIAIDLLTLDDDDGLIENGTPHYHEICVGFQQHGMNCPAIANGLVVKGTGTFDAEGPSDGPFAPASVSYTLHNLGPEELLTYSVTPTSDVPWLTVEPSGGTIAIGEQALVTVSIDQAQAALLPDGHHSATLAFVNETSGVGTVSREAKLQVGAPVPVYTATFESGLEGFNVDTEYGNIWHHSTACLDGLPGHTSGGSLYYGKDDLCNYTTSIPILHTVTSPVIQVTNPAMAELGFNYYLATEDDPNYDNATVLVSVNGGAFAVVASNNEGGEELSETNSWRELRVDISQLFSAPGPSSVQLQFAFNAVDPNSNSKAGFAVDDITLYAQLQDCTSDEQCDDHVYCNGTETCVAQTCMPGTAVDCNDDNACTDDVCDAELCTHVDNGMCTGSDAFVEHNGMVVIEAENFAQNLPRSLHSWDLVANTQASGQTVMTANPNYDHFINSDYATTSPQLSYAVEFSTMGTYYVWLRGIGPSANDDSCHVGIDGAPISTADRLTGFGTGLSWSRNTMDGPLATLHITQPGVHDINVWMREDGFSIDKLVLTTNPFYRPSGKGPLQSERESSDGPCDAYCPNPVSFSASNYQSGNLGTNATCHATTGPLNGGVCGNLTQSRQLFVNGVQMLCNWVPWSSLPPPENDGYCIHTTSGDYAWAAFATW